jgi:hypothetical protein
MGEIQEILESLNLPKEQNFVLMMLGEYAIKAKLVVFQMPECE